MTNATQENWVSTIGEPLEIWQWEPQEAPRAILQFVHGMAEHIARNDETARHLADAGYLVVGHTQLGHGKSTKLPGWFAQDGGWDALVEDVHALRLRTQAQHPDLPYFLLGHSMGSFVVRTYCQRYEHGLAGVILSGTGHFEPLILNAGLLIANIQCALGGEKKPSKLLESISFAGYNRDWMPTRTGFDWLSKDRAVVDAYVDDPLCGFPFTAGGYRDMFRGLKNLYPNHLGSMDKTVPILIFSGGADPVGARGVGVQLTERELLTAGVTNVTMRLYENGRHEMLNELERETLCNDLIAWLDGVLQR